MSIFNKKREISRREFRRELERATPYIPKTAGRRYSRTERKAIEKELFGRKFGGHISRDEYKERLKQLTRARLKCKTLDEKRAAERKIRYLKKLGGLK